MQYAFNPHIIFMRTRTCSGHCILVFIIIIMVKIENELDFSYTHTHTHTHISWLATICHVDAIILFCTGDICISWRRIDSDPCPAADIRHLCHVLDLHSHSGHKENTATEKELRQAVHVQPLRLHAHFCHCGVVRVRGVGSGHFEFPLWRLFDSECLCASVCG